MTAIQSTLSLSLVPYQLLKGKIFLRGRAISFMKGTQISDYFHQPLRQIYLTLLFHCKNRA